MAGIQSISITSYGDSGADGAVTYADLAALKASQLPATGSSKLAFVQSRHAWFSWDATSTLTANDLDVVVSTANGASDGRWIRLMLTHRVHQMTATWYLDYTNGLDDNTGFTSGTALKTCRELALRLAGYYSVTITINVLTNLNSSDPLILALNTPTDYVSNGNNTAPSVKIVGTKTLVRSGTISAVTAPVTATNTPGSITDSGATWATSIANNYVIYLTSGVSSGKLMWPCKDLGGNATRVNLPVTSTTGTVGTFPSVNDTYSEYSLTTGQIHLATFGAAQIYDWNQPSTTTGFQLGLNQVGYFGCAFGNLQSIFSAIMALVASRDGSSTAMAGLTQSRVTVAGCTIMKSGWTIRNFAAVNITGSLFQGFGIITNTTTGSVAQAHVSLTTTGFMDATTAIAISRGATCRMSTTVWGASNTTAVSVITGGKIFIDAAATPTITGTTEISIDGVANLLPALEASAGAVLPAAAACTTWAQWAAAPFNRNAFCYNSLAGIHSS